VDGCVVFDPELTLLGFGAKISAQETKPCVVFRARESEFPINNLGTRHQSAYRLCSKRPGAIAFVISQDGTLRSFLGEDGCVPVAETDAMRGFGPEDW
jgi:hypothetical protein